MTFSGVLVIGNHPKLFKKKIKESKKKSSNFSKIKILLCNSYARITKMLNFFENSNYLATKSDKMMISILFSTALNMRPYFLKLFLAEDFGI